jgi:hypothetical protein
MARLLIDDVTLCKGDHDDTIVQIRFRGGATRTLTVPLPKPAWMIRQTPRDIVATIDQLLDDHTDDEIVNLLNQKGMTSGTGKPFCRRMVASIKAEYGLKSRYARLRARGFLDQGELAKRLDVQPCTIKIWRRAGLLHVHRYNDKGECLFERPGADAPVKYKHQDKTRGKFAPS